mgnify:CR=1 FL=1
MQGDKVKVITFGCRLNSYESEVIKDILLKNDVFAFTSQKIVIFNSCAVTKEAERQLCQSIRRAKKEGGDGILIGVVGCAVQVNKGFYASMPEVDFIIGNNLKLELSSYTNITNNPVVVQNDLQNKRNLNHIISGFENKSRAFVQIQNGCNNQCSFCLTRLARGKSISLNPKMVIEQIKKLVDSGYKEIVLTGINIGDYGSDFEEKLNLGILIEKILQKTSIERLRLSSLDIACLNNETLDVIKGEDRLMPHLHLSLQSGDNMILKRMMRRHTREDVFDICSEILSSRPNVVFGADFIAGFPTETEDMHKNSLEVIEKVPITYGHIFPYSERSGTKAALMPQLPKNIRKSRAKELRNLAEFNMNKLRNSLLGTKQKVLIETKNLGRLENYLQVNLEGDFERNIGEILEVVV